MDKKLDLDKKMNNDATRKFTDKSVYSTPQLKSYGNAVEITLGGGGKLGDGGSNNTRLK